MRILLIALIIGTVFNGVSEVNKRLPSIYKVYENEDESVEEGKARVTFDIQSKRTSIFIRSSHTEEWEEITYSRSTGKYTELMDTGRYYIRAKSRFSDFEEGTALIDLKGGTDSEYRVHLHKQRYKEMQTRKPAVYLYSDQDLEMDVHVTPVGKFTFTYPEHKDGWNVRLMDNQLIVDGKPYDYLFWEGERSLITIPDSGFVVLKDETVQFLEQTLEKFGLNSKETNDFITYWGPELVRNSANHITFIYGDTYDKLIGEIKCSVPVDFQLRLFMLYTPCYANKEVEKQTLPDVKRTKSGLRLIEWGGGLAGSPNL